MASLFHLAFEFVRISILSCIYGLILWFVFSRLFKQTPIKKIAVISITFIFLFFWRFSYWRNNGLGDFGRVPLTSKYSVEMIDWSHVYVKENKENVGQTEFGIEKLYFENNILYGQYYDKNYLFLNTKNETLIDSIDEEKFKNLGGKKHKLIDPDEFHSNYWGWKLLFY